MALTAEVFDPHHELRPHLQILRLGLVETKIEKDVPAAADTLQLFLHCNALVFT